MQPLDVPGLPAPVYDVKATATEPGKTRLVAAVAMLVMGKEAGPMRGACAGYLARSELTSES